MRNHGPSFLRRLSTASFLGALILLAFQLVRFEQQGDAFPNGTVIAGVPVGGLDRQASADRLVGAYKTPVELHYGEAIIHLNPAGVFQLDLEGMFAAAGRTRDQSSFWKGFLNYLWDRPIQAKAVPLKASISEDQIRQYLVEEVAPRYDRPPASALPVVGTLNIRPGSAGVSLDINRSLPLIEQALYSLTSRVVELPLLQTQPRRLSFQNLEIFLKQTVALADFDGLTVLFLLDLRTGQEIHFAAQPGLELAVQPDIAFSAASMIKIPIMVSVFRRLDEHPAPETQKLLEEMIEKSGNYPADLVMQQVIDPKIAPVLVTRDMRALGLENTFLGGFFYAGAPLLDLYQTAANQRTDVNTDPDIYNQTTPSDMGMLLEDLYQCSQSGGGTFVAVFQDEITQAECQTMLTYLARNRLAELVEAGVPEGTRVAHKHGWVSEAGILHTLGDAGIVDTPGGDYILVIFLYQPTQLVWDPASRLVADLSKLVYSFYNMPGQ
jgi:beta-lactamase class A